MSRTASRRWTVFSLVGIAAWVGLTVAVAALNADPADERPVVLTFAAGGAAFFAAVFGVAWWQTRPREDPRLDALLAELSVEPGAPGGTARSIAGLRRTARVYIALGALVTALGLGAIVQEALGVGSARVTLFAIVAIVVVWAAAVPLVLRRANAASAAVLGPLGLSQAGAALAGERHGRQVSVTIDPRGSTTRVREDAEPPALAGHEIAAYAGRGDESVWADVAVGYARGAIEVRRRGHAGASWLWDLWLAERLATEAG